MVRDRPPGRLPHPARRADVQALDGQGLELGPLLQRPRPGRRATRTSPGTSSARRSTTRTRPARCPTRSPTPRCSTTSSSRPIHGWALSRLRQRLTDGLADADLERDLPAPGALDRVLARPPRAPGSPLPHYQHGNDSGWDNATTFDADRVIETADLAAFLVLQMRELADLADRARQARRRGTRWRAADRTLLAAMLAQLWTGERFAARDRRAPGEPAHQREPAGPDAHRARRPTCPPRCTTALAAQIAAPPHRARPGHRDCPTRRTTSADGYWRGPIWAPSTVLIEDGLRRAGHRRPRRRGQQPLPRRCARRPASPRTSTPRPAPGCATAPTPGPPAATSSSPRPPRGVSHCAGSRISPRKDFWPGARSGPEVLPGQR